MKLVVLSITMPTHNHPGRNRPPLGLAENMNRAKVRTPTTCRSR
jgi:hypothetical protein